MSRTNCPGCGATVDMVKVKGKHERLPIEIAAEAASPNGPDRYRIVGLSPIVVDKVAADAVGSFFPDHRHDCPAFNNGK